MKCDLSTNNSTCPRCGFVSKVRGAIRQCRAPAATKCGPGCHLKRLLSWWRIRDDGSCGCNEFAAQMDAWGPDGCVEHTDDIIGHLAEAAVRRGLPFVPVVARALVRSAISNARSEADGKKAAAEAG